MRFRNRDHRALDYIERRLAHELDNRPLDSIWHLKRDGLIEVQSRGTTPRHGPSTIWRLSEKGREALAAYRAESPSHD